MEYNFQCIDITFSKNDTAMAYKYLFLKCDLQKYFYK